MSPRSRIIQSRQKISPTKIGLKPAGKDWFEVAEISRVEKFQLIFYFLYIIIFLAPSNKKHTANWYVWRIREILIDQAMFSYSDHVADYRVKSQLVKCNTRTCDMCGLDRVKREFPSVTLRLTKPPCRMCSFMTVNNIACLHCADCGVLKPIMAFSSRQKRNRPKKCRICMKKFFCDRAEIV